MGSVLDEEVEVVEAEEDKEGGLSHVLHKAWEASRLSLRALNGVLGVELQPKELLLEAVGGMAGGEWRDAEW